MGTNESKSLPVETPVATENLGERVSFKLDASANGCSGMFCECFPV